MCSGLSSIVAVPDRTGSLQVFGYEILWGFDGYAFICEPVEVLRVIRYECRFLLYCGGSDNIVACVVPEWEVSSVFQGLIGCLVSYFLVEALDRYFELPQLGLELSSCETEALVPEESLTVDDNRCVDIEFCGVT